MLMESLLMQNVDTRKVSWISTEPAGSYPNLDGKTVDRFIMHVHLWTVPDNACGVGLIPMGFIESLEFDPHYDDENYYERMAERAMDDRYTGGF